MSVITRYDDMREDLKSELKQSLRKAKELVMGEDIWGYDEMRDGYAMEVYLKLKEVIDII